MLKGLSRFVLLLPLVLGPGALGCSSDLLVSVSNLAVEPAQASAGDQVKLTFQLTVIPERTFTITVFIDGAEHGSETQTGTASGLAEFALGDAADLIASYGLGVHQVRIRLDIPQDSRTLETATTSFSLQ